MPLRRPVVPLQGGRGIAVERRADLIREVAQIDILRVEDAITIGKMVHETA
jgi:hypothetical protein